jgi:hypothetical protein
MNFNLIGKVEHMQDFMRLFKRRIGIGENEASLEAANASAGESPYTDATAAVVQRLYNDDFLLFEYGNSCPKRPATPEDTVSRKRFLEEVIERNQMIALLNEHMGEAHQARSELRKVQKFGFVSLANAILTVLKLVRR